MSLPCQRAENAVGHLFDRSCTGRRPSRWSGLNVHVRDHPLRCECGSTSCHIDSIAVNSDTNHDSLSHPKHSRHIWRKSKKDQCIPMKANREHRPFLPHLKLVAILPYSHFQRAYQVLSLRRYSHCKRLPLSLMLPHPKLEVHYRLSRCRPVRRRL